MTGGSLFECVDGYLEGYSAAVVHQSQFSEDYGGNKMWGTGTSFKITAWVFDDDNGDGENAMGLWWADYFETTYDNTDRIVYSLFYNYQRKQLILNGEFVGDGVAYGEAIDPEFTGGSMELEAVDAPEFKMDLSKPDKFTIGMKIDNGVIKCYLNDQCLITHNAERGAVCGSEARSPLLLWNIGNYCGWDDFICSTADYNLFNESAAESTAAPADDTTKAQDETTKVETKTVVVTDENGEAHTEIVTEIVTNAPKQETNNNGGSANNGGAQTGDMAIVVIAVMVVSLGAAIVVKKVND